MKQGTALYHTLMALLAAALILALPGINLSGMLKSRTALAASQADALISIATNIPASRNAYVDIPVNFAPNGGSIASIVFAIDYDQNWLLYENTPGAITFSLPTGFIGSCSTSTPDPDGEIKCVIYDPGYPLEALPEGTLMTFRLKTLSPAVQTSAAVGFSVNSPPVSFGGIDGQHVDGAGNSGSVLIQSGTVSGRLSVYLPLLMRNETVDPGPTETPEPTPEPTPIVTVTPPPQGCQNHLLNSGFEMGQSWEFPATVFPATYTTYRAQAGSRSVRTGIDAHLNPSFNIYSYSSFRQLVLIPSNATSIKLKYWEFPISGEAPQGMELPQSDLPKVEIGKPLMLSPQDSDLQYVLLLDAADNSLERLAGQLSNLQNWRERQLSINPSLYRGTYIKIQFGVYNNGWGGVTGMYIDNATLEICAP